MFIALSIGNFDIMKKSSPNKINFSFSSLHYGIIFGLL